MRHIPSAAVSGLPRRVASAPLGRSSLRAAIPMVKTCIAARVWTSSAIEPSTTSAMTARDRRRSCRRTASAGVGNDRRRAAASAEAGSRSLPLDTSGVRIPRLRASMLTQMRAPGRPRRRRLRSRRRVTRPSRCATSACEPKTRHSAFRLRSCGIPNRRRNLPVCYDSCPSFW